MTNNGLKYSLIQNFTGLKTFMNAPNFPTSTFAQNTLIFSKGDEATKFYMIQSGLVEIFDPISNQTIAQLSEGDAFGEQAIIVGGIRGASAKALKQTICLEVTTIKLREMLRYEEGILRPTIEALLLQLTMHNELKSLSALGKEPIFEVSKRFSSSFSDPTYEIVEEEKDEFPREERIRINREIEKAKHFVILNKGDRLETVYAKLKDLKEKEARARMAAIAPKVVKPQVPEEKKIKRDELTEFLASDEAKHLPTRDLLYLKLFDNKSLDSTAFNPGQKILAPGDQPNKAYIITSGEVSQSSPITGFSTLGPGAVIALAEGISNTTVQSTTTARGSVIAISIPIVKAMNAIRTSNIGLLGIARFTAMRVLELDTPPQSLSR
jgi:CRP/FNR family cyclic AMP-dependent transcriptional regulator